jgi:hypothetical protein
VTDEDVLVQHAAGDQLLAVVQLRHRAVDGLAVGEDIQSEGQQLAVRGERQVADAQRQVGYLRDPASLDHDAPGLGASRPSRQEVDGIAGG